MDAIVARGWRRPFVSRPRLFDFRTCDHLTAALVEVREKIGRSDRARRSRIMDCAARSPQDPAEQSALARALAPAAALFDKYLIGPQRPGSVNA